MKTSGLSGILAASGAIIVLVIVLGFGAGEKEAITLDNFEGRVVSLEERALHSGTGTIILDVDIPFGYALLEDVPARLSWISENADAVRLGQGEFRNDSVIFPFELAYVATAGKSKLVFDAVVYGCQKRSKVCISDEARIVVPVSVSEEGRSELRINFKADLPEATSDF